MRFVMFMIPDVYQPQNKAKLTADFAPPADAVEKMMQYNERLAKAGVLVALDGLQPLDKGARVSYSGGQPVATDGPYIESKEVVGGYWIIKVNSKEEAVQWAMEVPAADGDVIEVRQIFDFEDFPEDVQKAGDSTVVRDAIGG